MCLKIISGLIDFLVSKHKIAQELREKLIFKVIHFIKLFFTVFIRHFCQ